MRAVVALRALAPLCQQGRTRRARSSAQHAEQLAAAALAAAAFLPAQRVEETAHYGERASALAALGRRAAADG